MKLPNLNTLYLRSGHLESAKLFYEALGFSFERIEYREQPSFHEYQTNMLTLSPHSHEFYTLVPREDEFVAGNAITLQFEVASLAQVIEALRKIGVGAQEHQPRSGQARDCYLHDPDGRAVRVIQVTS